MINFEDSPDLDPELTVENASDAIFEAIESGLLTKEDFKQFLRLSYEGLATPKKLKILSKAVGHLLEKGYKGKLRLDETPAVLVTEESKQYLVAYDFKKISISGPVDFDCKDGSLIIMHESEADAKIAAWERDEEFVENKGKTHD